jgi:hypothetical protein
LENKLIDEKKNFEKIKDERKQRKVREKSKKAAVHGCNVQSTQTLTVQADWLLGSPLLIMPAFFSEIA